MLSDSEEQELAAAYSNGDDEDECTEMDEQWEFQDEEINANMFT